MPVSSSPRAATRSRSSLRKSANSAGADAFLLGRDHVDVAGGVEVVRHVSEAGLDAVEQAIVVFRDGADPSPGRFENEVENRPAGPLRRLDRGRDRWTAHHVAVGIRLPDEEDRHSLLLAEPDIDVDEFRADDREHVRIDVGDVDAGALGRLDLGTKLGLDRIRVRMGAGLLRRPPEIAVGVDEPGSLRGPGQRAPAIGLPFRRQDQVDADVEARVARLHLGDLQKPRAGHHDRAGGADAEPRQLGEGGLAPWHMPMSSSWTTTRRFPAILPRFGPSIGMSVLSPTLQKVCSMVQIARVFDSIHGGRHGGSPRHQSDHLDQ